MPTLFRHPTGKIYDSKVSYIHKRRLSGRECPERCRNKFGMTSYLYPYALKIALAAGLKIYR
jgi:hypothetical protein